MPSPYTTQGGVAARRGFRYQDHYAAGVLLRAIHDPSIVEVALEVDDDIRIKRLGDGDMRCEYVQVKTTAGDSHWSVTELCARDAGREGTSILERSLSMDDDPGSVGPIFRLVTSRDVRAELRPLKLAMAAKERDSAVAPVVKATAEKLGAVSSPGGRDLEYWCEHTLWVVASSADAIQYENHEVLGRVAHATGGYVLTPDQIDIAYTSLLESITQISTEERPSIRSLTRQSIITLMESAISLALPHSGPQPQNRLRKKMEAGLIEEAIIEQAEERRRRYVQEVLSPQYAPMKGYDLVVDEVGAILSDLLDTYLGDKDPETPSEFHVRCKQAIRELVAELPSDCRPAGYGFAYGSMYEVANRCQHRFTQEEPE